MSPLDLASGQSDRDALAGFLPPVARWFRQTFAALSPAQALAWPVIRRGENTLLLAPTGSGKTLAAFLCAIDDLYRRGATTELREGVHVLYVTPLKALGNDIQKNLLQPLAGIRAEADGALPELRAAVRSGDTPANERARMVRQPPHILITTPESLYLLLGSARMAEALRSVRTVIVDEVHALCASKRGVHLAVSLERLAAHVGGPLQRVGCSATLSPLEEIAAFLVGRDTDGRPRPCTIVNAGMRKDLDVQVMAPLPDFLEASNTALWSSAYELLLGEIARHRTTLIFTNSRYKAERTALRLTDLALAPPPPTPNAQRLVAHSLTRPLAHSLPVRVGVHHGSMSKETRLEAEDDLKAGRLDALVATASLELGIDVGSIDLVYQLESPKSVATGQQRIGRAGHQLDATSKGRLLLFERDDLLEAAAICKAMLAGEVDAVRIPRGCLDVLAQQIAGAVAAGDWEADALFALVRRAYPYSDLPREQFEAVLGMLAGEHPFQMARPPKALLLWDRASGRLSAARGGAHVCAQCVGTISEASEYEVVIAGSNKRVGTVQSEFVDDSLRIGDVFVLGSSSWRVVGVRRNRLLVEEAPGSTPTVPWWTGPVEARTAEVGRGVGLLRREIAARLDDPDLPTWLEQEYRLSPHAATALIDYVREQKAAAGLVPDYETLLVETWRDELGRLNVIVHSPYGQRINRTWGIALATAAKQQFHQDWSVTASNDVLLLTLAEPAAPHPNPPQGERAGPPLPLGEGRGEGQDTQHPAPSTERPTPNPQRLAPNLLASVTPEALPELLAKSAESAAAASGSAFRETAVCSFQILRAWQGKRVPLWLQNHRAQGLHEAARSCRDYPVVAEVRRDYLQDTLDLPGLQQLLRQIITEDFLATEAGGTPALPAPSTGRTDTGAAGLPGSAGLPPASVAPVVAASPVRLVFRDVESPSPFAHSLLIHDRYRGDHQMGRDRRAHLLRLHRQVLQEVLSAEQMAQLLDERAIEGLERRLLHRSEATQARSSDELAQVIRDLGDLPAAIEVVAEVVDGDAAAMLASLGQEGRVVAVRLPDVEQDPVRLVAADLWRQYVDAFGLDRPGQDASALAPVAGGEPVAHTPTRPLAHSPSVLQPQVDAGTISGFAQANAADVIPARWRQPVPQAEARAAVVERYLRCRGPVTLYELANHTGWPVGAIEGILQRLVDEGTVARGVYTSSKPRPQWVNRANLEEIHRLTLGYLRRELAACAPYEVVDFVTRWQHLHPATRPQGLDGLREVIRQLQGVEVMQGALETEVLPGRVVDYHPEMLDRLIASGEVCWRRVSTKAIRRGVLALCCRKDVEWLACGSPLEFDVEREADCDIPDVIRAVREHFRAHHTAFFGDVAAATGHDEGAVMRAVWYLAWCGELTCDTFECVRHADFQTTLSACYDLDSTPRKIASGRITAERALKHMWRRKLDPRLGRWSATERLVRPAQPLPEDEITRRWAEQLLGRWGIVTKDILATEVAAPPWATLVREFKRLELLGKVNRGYFVESHQGEQYGLPEAIELLRDCRARRSDGKQLGYLPDEPLFCLTNRDPANLYASCLDMVDERGELFQPRLKQGNVTRRTVVQAGQVLLYGCHQLVTLTRRQLARCIEQLKRDEAGRDVELRFRSWNGYPMDVSPVAGLLSELGLRFDARRHLCWPPPRPGHATQTPPSLVGKGVGRLGPSTSPPSLIGKGAGGLGQPGNGAGASGSPSSPPSLAGKGIGGLGQPSQEVFPPYYSEPPPVTYGPEWTIGRAAEPIRPALQKLSEVLLSELDRDGWEVLWDARAPSARYRDLAGMGLYIAKSFIDVQIWTRSLRLNGKSHRFRRRMRIAASKDVEDGFVAKLRSGLDAAEELVDGFLTRRNNAG